MNILVYNSQKKLPLNTQQAVKVVVEMADRENRRFDEAAVHFVSTRKIKTLHQQFFGDPSSTDCITLPIDQDEGFGYKVLGEVFICPATAIDFIRKHGGCPYEETTLYLVHAILHLFGYEDLECNDRLIMREREAEHMRALKEKKLILTP